jgi:hypothetical protein
MNKQDQIVFFEELSRAAALLTLKKQCNEQEYKNFLTILENYENNLVLTESKVQGSEKYKGFLNFFAENKLLQEATIPNIDVFKRLDAETQAKVLEKMPEGEQKEEYKKVVKPAEASNVKPDETSNNPEEEQKGSKFFQGLPPSDRVALQAKGIKKDMDEVELAKYILKSKDSVGRPDMSDIGKIEAEQFLKARNIPIEDSESEVNREPTPEEENKADQEADKIKAAAENNPDPLASELGKLAAQYVDNYGGFFNQLATNVWGLFNPRKFQQYRRQQILGLLAMLKKQAGEAGVPGSDKIETGEEAVETAQEEAESQGEVVSTVPKDTKLSIMTRQNVKASADGKKEMPLVMSLQKQGFSQQTAQRLAKRIRLYFKQRRIPVAEAVQNGTLDRVLLEVRKLNLLSEVEEEKSDVRTPKRKKVNRKSAGDRVRTLRQRIKELEFELRGHKADKNRNAIMLTQRDLNAAKEQLKDAIEGTGGTEDLKARDRKNKEEYEAEVDKLRKYIRLRGKDLGVIGKILSRFISDNQDLIDRDPRIKKILDNPREFRKFAKSVTKNIKRMFKRRGYTDEELEKMRILEYVENNLKLLILENNRNREIL